MHNRSMHGKVLGLRIKPKKGGMTQPKAELSLIAGRGIEGDCYFDDASRDKRQVLLLDQSTLTDFGYQPGLLREQVLVDFPGLQALEPGARVKLGQAVVEITFDCAPCLTMAGYVNENGQEFVRKMMGRRGMLARVVASGIIKEGDTIEVTDQ